MSVIRTVWTDDMNKLLTDLVNQQKSYHEIMDIMNLTQHIIMLQIKKLGLKYQHISKYNNNLKKIYQDYDWCYEQFITNGLNHLEIAEKANCSTRVIKKWVSEIFRLTTDKRMEELKLNEVQKDLIIGSLLGDGHIDKRETQPLFIVCHAENQKDYLFWKYEICKNLCNKSPSYTEGKDNVFVVSQYCNTQGFYRICTRIVNDLLYYRSLSKKDIISLLNIFSLCVFMLDDGYRSSSNWGICMGKLTEEDNMFFINTMQKRFKLICWIEKKDKRYIKFDAESSRKIDKMILDNIPNELDIIQYKIVNKYRKGY